MSWADLEKLQGSQRPDGSMMVVIRDDRVAAAITETRHLSILFAISRVAHGRRLVEQKYGGKGKVVYVTSGLPPAFLIEAVSASGGVVFDGAREHALAKPPELTVLLDSAFCDVAIAVKRRLKVRTMKDALEVRELELRRRPVDVASPEARWTAIFELVALTGEAVREKRPGRWILDPALDDVRFPHALDLGGGQKVLPLRLASAVVAGSPSSLSDLLASTERATTIESRGAAAARIMPLLSDRRALPAETRWEQLVPDEVDTPELPVIAYIEDLDESIGWGVAQPISPALRQQALTNLGAEAHRLTIEEPAPGVRVAVVIGGYYGAEAILHRPTMRAIEAKLEAEALLVGLPARGMLVAITAALDDAAQHAFLLLVEKYYLTEIEAARVTSEVLVYHGKPIGRVQSNQMDTRRALRRMGIDPDA